jgi:hypothetical protein
VEAPGVSFILDVADPTWKEHVLDTEGLLVDQVRRSSSLARAAPAAPG